jgi:hypothetical protein
MTDLLPGYLSIEKKKMNGEQLNALERFILDEEPAKDDDHGDEKWREALQKAIIEGVNRVLKAIPSESERKKAIDAMLEDICRGCGSLGMCYCGEVWDE